MFFFTSLLFSLTVIDVRSSVADLGFSCSGDPNYYETGKYRALSNSEFGVRRFSKEFEAQISNCDGASLYLLGTISSSDHLAFLRFVKHYPRSLAFGGYLILNSTGGNLDAAIKIARFVRKLGLVAVVAHRSTPNGPIVCYSSCVLVLAGAMLRHTGSLENEISNIGIHRPYLGKATKDMTASEARNQLSSIKAMLRSALKEFNLQLELADRMMSVPPAKVKLLTGDELGYWGLNEDDPIHQTRSNNQKAIRYGISVAEWVRREQIVNVHCMNSALISFNECLANVWSGGSVTPLNSRLKQLPRQSRAECEHLNPRSNGSSEDPSVDYAKAMDLKDVWYRCMGQFIEHRR
jgi:hypothetical protein